MAVALIGAACGSVPPTAVEPTPNPGAVVPIVHQGPTEITFSNASIPPGASISGCGDRIAGCAGRLRVTYMVRSAAGGTALFLRAWLYGDNQRGCLYGSTPPFALPAGQTVAVDVLLDHADDCGIPLTIRAMAANVEGTVEISTRQEWTIHYTFLP